MGKKTYCFLKNRIEHINVIPFVLVLFFISFFCDQAWAKDCTLSWDANSDPDIAGYVVYFKADSSGQPYGDYDEEIDVGDVTSATIEGLDADRIYFFAATAYDTSGIESDFSNEVSTEDLTSYSPNNSILSPDSSRSGGCLILTTAHGHDYIPYIEIITVVVAVGFFGFLRRKIPPSQKAASIHKDEVPNK